LVGSRKGGMVVGVLPQRKERKGLLEFGVSGRRGNPVIISKTHERDWKLGEGPGGDVGS